MMGTLFLAAGTVIRYTQPMTVCIPLILTCAMNAKLCAPKSNDELLREKLKGKKAVFLSGASGETGDGDEDGKDAEAFVLGADVEVTEELLSSIHEKLIEDGELYVERKAEDLDFSDLSLLLVKCDFMHVVTLRKRRGVDPVIRCMKAEKEDALLSVIVPLYNEENTAKELLEKLFAFDWPMAHEFVIVESNSDDNTRGIVESYADRDDVKIVLEEKPSGKGNGVLHGIAESSGQFIAIQDGDLEYDVEDYRELLSPLRDHETQFMLGSRYRKETWRMREFSKGKSLIADYLNLGQKLLTWLLNTACGSKLSDPFTMYKIFHRDCLYGIDFVGGNFGLDWEIVIRFLRKGYRPREIPISYQARSYEEGKHISLIGTPIEGLRALWRCRFVSDVYDYGDD